jgi:hypothetical protein
MPVAAAIVAVFVTPAGADVVELKNGQRVEGILKQADQSTVMTRSAARQLRLRPNR